MKYLLLVISVFFLQYTRAQTATAIIKKADTLIYHSEIIRNNLSGQKILMSREDGTVYQMEQDGMPCFAPKSANAARIPNIFAPKPRFDLVQPMPVVPPKKGLPKFVPKKPGRF